MISYCTHLTFSYQSVCTLTTFAISICIKSLVQDCGNSSALAMELLLSCAKPSIFFYVWYAHPSCTCLVCHIHLLLCGHGWHFYPAIFIMQTFYLFVFGSYVFLTHFFYYSVLIMWFMGVKCPYVLTTLITERHLSQAWKGRTFRITLILKLHLTAPNRHDS